MNHIFSLSVCREKVTDENIKQCHERAACVGRWQNRIPLPVVVRCSNLDGVCTQVTEELGGAKPGYSPTFTHSTGSVNGSPLSPNSRAILSAGSSHHLAADIKSACRGKKWT